jgi:hypothetical protein
MAVAGDNARFYQAWKKQAIHARCKMFRRRVAREKGCFYLPWNNQFGKRRRRKLSSFSDLVFLPSLEKALGAVTPSGC